MFTLSVHADLKPAAPSLDRAAEAKNLQTATETTAAPGVETRVEAHFAETNPNGAGRYAPSPTGELHIGNLRTALLAWMWARATGRRFYMRVEDLDQSRYRSTDQQLGDLRNLGIDWDGEAVIQTERLHLYEDGLGHLKDDGLVFECYCSRKDIREAVSAAHGDPGTYPGTCLNLTEDERSVRRKELASQGRKPALRLRPHADSWTITDVLHGSFTGPIDNVVLRRGDGAFAYNLAVAVDDHLMGIDQIVRGDDLLTSAPVHSYLRHALRRHYPEAPPSEPIYIHVPLVLGPTGKRLSKRDGAVTIADLAKEGASVSHLIEMIANSLDLPPASSAEELLAAFGAERGSVGLAPWKIKARQPSAPLGKFHR